eukprot:gene18798-25343_t
MGAKPCKQSIEPKGLNPEMSPDPIVKETPVEFLKNLIVLSFVLVIGLMLATFAFVWKVGGISLAGID